MSQSDGGEPPPPPSSEDSAVLDACARAAEQYYSPRRGRAKTIDGELLQAMRKAISTLPETATRAARRSITGDPEMRIRDRAREAFVRPKRPSVVRAVDKALFTGAVGWILLTEYVVLCYPKLLGQLYVCTMTPLLIYRAMDYYFVRHWTYFMFDFCYALNGLVFSLILLPLDARNWGSWQLLFDRRPAAWGFPCAFALCNGPLLAAVLAWRNSFVFHNLDKVTSTALHAGPPLWTFVERWCTDSQYPADVDLVSWYAIPILFYGVWQVLYIVKTEFIDAAYLETAPEEVTSLRWLSRDESNGMNRLCKYVCVKLGQMAPDESFDDASRKTKLTFWAGQLVYTVVTLVATPLLWRYKALHALCLFSMFATAIYSGASYYIEVFTRRYNDQFRVS